MLKLGLRQIADSIAKQQITDIVYPNDVINNSIINDNYLPMEQINFLLAFAQPEITTYYDTSNQLETGKGELPVPFSTDFYLGEVL